MVSLVNTPARLCYILPAYDDRSLGNLRHKYGFVEKLALSVEVFLIFESGRGKVSIRNVKRTYIQKFRGKPWSQIELFLTLIRARLAGYRSFYSHFSIRPALYAKIITSFFGGKVFLFHCADFKRSDLTDSPSKQFRLLWTLRHVDYLITASPAMARHYAVEFGVDHERIRLVPNWINLDRFRTRDRATSRNELGIKAGKRVILFVHQLSQPKGAYRLPEIAASVRNRFPDVLFIIVGGPGTHNDASAFLADEIVRKDLGDVVRLEGGVPNEDVPGYYAAADVFIMPSESEGFPVVLLEAMASGVPFVVTDGGGPVADMLTPRQRSFMVSAGDVDGFCNKLMDLLSDPDECYALSEEGYAHVAQFSTERVLEIYLREVVSLCE
jgi:glycosyltransferase involved in cell wall biosynthesis